jgi:hypothetical protein
MALYLYIYITLVTSKLEHVSLKPTSHHESYVIHGDLVFFPLALQPDSVILASPFSRLRSSTHLDTSHEVGLSGRVISPTQGPLPDNT